MKRKGHKICITFYVASSNFMAVFFRLFQIWHHDSLKSNEQSEHACLKMLKLFYSNQQQIIQHLKVNHCCFTYKQRVENICHNISPNPFPSLPHFSTWLESFDSYLPKECGERTHPPPTLNLTISLSLSYSPLPLTSHLPLVHLPVFHLPHPLIPYLFIRSLIHAFHIRLDHDAQIYKMITDILAICDYQNQRVSHRISRNSLGNLNNQWIMNSHLNMFNKKI